MTAQATALILVAALSLAACGKADDPEAAPTATATATATATSAAEGAGTGEGVISVEKTVVFKADSKTGEVGIDLPGGTGASLRLPPEVLEKMGKDSNVDVDGVGLYPGARVTEIAATSREKGADKSGSATIRFSAPSTPQAVAEWYVAAFRDKGHSARRTGNRVEGTTTEGSRFTLDLAAEGQGTAGTLVVIDGKAAG